MSTGFDRIRQAKEAARQAEAEVQAAVKAMTRTFQGCEVSFHLENEAVMVTIRYRQPSKGLPHEVYSPHQAAVTMPLTVAAEMAQYLLEIAASEREGQN
jgi:hypothetical protein